MIKCN